jgi:hypothetical protein
VFELAHALAPEQESKCFSQSILTAARPSHRNQMPHAIVVPVNGTLGDSAPGTVAQVLLAAGLFTPEEAETVR